MTMTQCRLFAMLCVIMCGNLCSARLYETPEQCEQRYGQPENEQRYQQFIEITRDYRSADYLVRVGFAKGKQDGTLVAAFVFYKKLPVAAEDKLNALSHLAKQIITPGEFADIRSTTAGQWKKNTDHKHRTELQRLRYSLLEFSKQFEPVRLDEGDVPWVNEQLQAYAFEYSLFQNSAMPPGEGGAVTANSGYGVALVSVRSLRAFQAWKVLDEEKKKKAAMNPRPPKGL